MLFNTCYHKICFLHVLRFLSFQYLLFPEIPFLRQKILFYLQISFNESYKKFLLIIPIKTGDIGFINVHDGHIMPNLVFIVDGNCIISPFLLAVIVGCLTFQDSIASVRKLNKKVHIHKHPGIQRMSEHCSYRKNLKSGLLRKYLCDQIFQSVSYFLCYPVILIFLQNRTDTCFVIKEISFGCKR